MDVNDEDDLFGAGEPAEGDGGDAGAGGQDVTQDQPKDGGDDLGADDSQQKASVEGDADQSTDGDKPKDDKDAGTAEGDKPEDDKGGKDDKEDKYVPKAALDSEKRRRRELAQRLKKLEDRDRERELAAARASAPRPGDPGYEEYQRRVAVETQVHERMNRSEYDARKEHGDEAIDEMMAWAEGRFTTDQQWASQVFGHAHPYDFAMREFKKHQEAQAAPSDHGDQEYAAFLAWKKSQGEGVQSPPAAAAAPATPPAKAPPPISLAQRHSAGAGTPPATANKDAFDQEFG